MGLIDAVARHPWASLAVGGWLLIALSLTLSALKECVAIAATRTRPPEPDWRTLSRPYSAGRSGRRRRHSGGRSDSPHDGESDS